MKKYQKIILSMTIPIIFTSCTYHSSTAKGDVGIKRKQLMLLSSNEINMNAKKQYTQVLEDAKKKGTLNSDLRTLLKVEHITNLIIPYTKIFKKDAPNWKWEVNTINSKELNAWCMPGGKIVVYNGLIDNLKLTDDELAVVLAHEISHALREHSREKVSRQVLLNTTLSIGGSLLGLGENSIGLAGEVANIGILLPNSRKAEKEADIIGLELAARAGFNPNSAVTLWEKMESVSKNKTVEFLSTHPSYQQRIKDIKIAIKKVMPIYKNSKQ